MYATTTGNGDVDGLGITDTARYVKTDLTRRGTGWRYSLGESGIYG